MLLPVMSRQSKATNRQCGLGFGVVAVVVGQNRFFTVAAKCFRFLSMPARAFYGIARESATKGSP